MGPRSVNPRRLFFILAAGCCFLSLLGAEPDAGRARIALFQPAGQKEDKTLAAVLCAMADCMELSLDVLQRYEVRRLPPADPAKDLERVCAYCQENRIDQAILGSGDERPGGGYRFRLVVYDRKSDSITTDRQGGSRGVLDMFAATDALLASLLKDLSGAHLIFGSLSVKTDPEGAMVSVDGKDVGQAPLSLRGLPVGTVELAARSEGLEEASATVTIVEGETTNASLKLSERQDAAAAGRSGEVGQNTLRNGDRLPKASISIDGKFDEWNGILPVFTSGTRSPKARNLAIEKAYLAVDEKNLYMRLDIKDVTPSSLLHPYNFDTYHYSVYGMNLKRGVYNLQVQLYYDTGASRWFALIQRYTNRRWEPIDRTQGNYAMTGPRLEALFPLEPIKKYLGIVGTGGDLFVSAFTGYSDSNWKWVQGSGDGTGTKLLTF